MQFPCVFQRGHGQQFFEADYGRFLGMIKEEDEVLFKQNGRDRCVHFASLPLPLTPPNTRTPYDVTECQRPEARWLPVSVSSSVPAGLPEIPLPPGHKFNVYNQLLYFYTNHLDIRFPVSIATELIPRDPLSTTESSCTNRPSSQLVRSPCLPDHVLGGSIVGHCGNLLLWASGPALSTLGVACVTSSSPAHNKKSFLNWMLGQSPLPLTPLQSLSMPGQIRDIQVTNMKDKGLVCVRCDYHLCLLRVIDEKLEVLSVHQTRQTITLTALSPHVFGECAVLTLSGELCLVSSRSKVTLIPTPTQEHPNVLCFGPHPRSVIIAVGNTAHKIDWRTNPARTCVLYECEEPVTCLSCEHSDPFVIIMATALHLILVDVRDPGRPTLSVQLNLLRPPVYAAVDNTSNDSVLLLVSRSECMVMGVSKSPPHRSTLLPHLVNNIRAVSNRLMVAGLPCEGKLGHVMYRLTHPILGATLLQKDSVFTTIVATDLGDMFQQSWTYKEAASATPPDLSPNGYHGYNLWVEEAFLQEKELAQYKELDPMGDIPFNQFTSREAVIDYTLSPEAPNTRLCLHCDYAIKNFIPNIDPAQHPSSLATTDAQCTFCGGVFRPRIHTDGTVDSTHSETAAGSVMDTLRECCTPTVASSYLDRTLLSGWPAQTGTE